MNKIVNTYLRQSICLTAGLSLLALLYANLWGDRELMTMPIVVSAVFQLVTCIAYGMVWRKVASSSPGSLPTLYLAASAIRMLAAIATVVIFLFLVDNKVAITTFVITFLSFYFVMLIYDTWYFVKVEKKIQQKTTN